jgi:tetratricopeptide (TPR) repeat protein
MSIFTKIFGPKVKDDQTAADTTAAEPGGNFISAISMHLRGELEQALSAYSRITEELPDDTLAPFFAAAIKAGQGNTVEAAESLRALSQRVSLTGETLSRAVILELVAQVRHEPLRIKFPAVAEVIVSFGDLLKKDGFVQESAVCFEIAAGLVPDNANVLHKLGDTLHDLRNYDYAESVLLEALKNAPNHWGAVYTYAVLLQDLGRDEEAITYYEKAARLYPDHANCQNNYGAALLRTNRLEEALTHCTKALALDPGSPFVKINLGNIYLLMQKYETARTCFAEAISLNNNLAPAYFGLASVEQSLKSDPKQIQELYLKAIEINPSIPEAHQALGNLLAAEGNPEALSHFSAAAQLNNNLKNLHKDFGYACWQLGRREEALDHLRIALQQNPDDVMVQDILAKMEAENPA